MGEEVHLMYKRGGGRFNQLSGKEEEWHEKGFCITEVETRRILSGKYKHTLVKKMTVLKWR